jgi:non-specific serine/threonine protein kinase
LERAEECTVVQRRHAAYFRLLAVQAATGTLGPAQVEWMQRIDRESDNVRSGLRWTVESGDARAELDIVGNLWDYWWMRGGLGEGRRALDGALQRSSEISSPARANALHGAGMLAAIQGDLELAKKRFGQSFEQFIVVGRPEDAVRPLVDLGLTHLFLGDTATGVKIIARALNTGRMRPAGWPYAYAVHAMGQARLIAGQDAEAARLSRKEIELWRQIGDMRGHAHALVQLAIAERRQGHAPWAIPLAIEALGLFEQLGETWGILGSLVVISACMVDLDRNATALGIAAAAQSSARIIGASLIPDWQRELDRVLAETRARLGQKQFERAFASNQHRSIENVITFALDAMRSGRLHQTRRVSPTGND